MPPAGICQQHWPGSAAQHLRRVPSLLPVTYPTCHRRSPPATAVPHRLRSQSGPTYRHKVTFETSSLRDIKPLAGLLGRDTGVFHKHLELRDILLAQGLRLPFHPPAAPVASSRLSLCHLTFCHRAFCHFAFCHFAFCHLNAPSGRPVGRVFRLVAEPGPAGSAADLIQCLVERRALSREEPCRKRTALKGHMLGSFF